MFLWEVFPWDFCPIISGAFVRSGTDVGQEGLAPNPHSRPNDPMVFYQVEVRALLGPVTPNSSNHVFMEYKMAFPKLFPQLY